MRLRRDTLPRLTGRRGEAAPLIVGAVCLTALLGTAAYWTTAGRVTAVPPTANVTTPATPIVAKETPAVTATPVAAAPMEAQPLPEAVPSTGDLVAAHLQAGEFGPALALALTVTDEAEQARLIHLVADAQVAAGEFEAALATLKKVPAKFVRPEDRDAIVMENALAGGTGADFGPLMDLIENETGGEDYGPWVDVHGSGGSQREFEAGVRVDPRGVLALVAKADADGRIAALSLDARKASLNSDMAKTSGLRMVSLTRLERAVAERVAAGKPVVESMRQLAGLSQIQYVFVYPQDNEIVIAGPAEAWGYDANGRAIGAESGRPTLQLDDLVTVLRTFSNTGVNQFGCSIDPRAENLRELKDFVTASQQRGPLRDGQAGRWASQLQQKLGMQDVTVYGVPADSRVARVLVEADYRMKLIGIGKLEAGQEIPDYFALLANSPERSSGRIDALRWWMTMQYDQVLHSTNRDAFEIRGSAVKCQSENEFLNTQGQRVQTGAADMVNRQFAQNFTEHYADLARREPVFADMQGIFDLALVAALIQTDRLDRQTGWDRGCFAPGGAYLTSRYPVPREVETVVNHRVYNGKDIVVQVAGGVRGDLLSVLTNPASRGESAKAGEVAQQSRAANLPEGRWWWDAK